MAITPNEIRTGNLFEYFLGVNDEGADWQPTALDWQDIKQCEEWNDDFNMSHRPIRITEEWLLNFGFEKDDYGFLQKENKHINWMMRIGNNMKWTSSTFGIQVDLKYVHQLQNLYFALTGLELVLSAVGEKI